MFLVSAMKQSVKIQNHPRILFQKSTIDARFEEKIGAIKLDKNTDPAVIGALISLREFNTVPSTHPSDRDEIVLTFRRLTKSGVHYNPDIVQKWLLCNGWMKENALNARKIAEYEKQHATLRDHPESAVDAWRKIDKAHRKQNDKTD